MLTKNVEAEALGTNGALTHAQVDPWRSSQLAIGLLTGMHREKRDDVPALCESPRDAHERFASCPKKNEIACFIRGCAVASNLCV